MRLHKMNKLNDVSGIDYGHIVIDDLGVLFPALMDHSTALRCPAYGENYPKVRQGVLGEFCVDYNDCLATLILHLNDEHQWTRAQIADWLETLDTDLEVKA